MNSFSTMIREYLAIQHLQNSKLLDYILNPSNSSPLSHMQYQNQSARCDVSYRILDKLNHSQKEAVFSIIESKSPISLIHGPPGTGKTQTTVGLLNIINEFVG
mmetsp:Transcript_95364/g.205770  ORF Transcript_95364/g.205770 Transcript_95364/m.205770 type:complete len:103 (+) Transcript_95364:811-1119(+)